MVWSGLALWLIMIHVSSRILINVLIKGHKNEGEIGEKQRWSSLSNGKADWFCFWKCGRQNWNWNWNGKRSTVKSCIIAHTSSESYLKGSLRCCLDICLVHQKEKVVFFVGTAYYLHIYCLACMRNALYTSHRSEGHGSFLLNSNNLFSEQTCMQALPTAVYLHQLQITQPTYPTLNSSAF